MFCFPTHISLSWKKKKIVSFEKMKIFFFLVSFSFFFWQAKTLIKWKRKEKLIFIQSGYSVYFYLFFFLVLNCLENPLKIHFFVSNFSVAIFFAHFYCLFLNLFILHTSSQIKIYYISWSQSLFSFFLPFKNLSYILKINWRKKNYCNKRFSCFLISFHIIFSHD